MIPLLVLKWSTFRTAHSPWHSTRRLGGVFRWFLLAIFTTAAAHAGSQLDYQLKAGYLYNFAKFVDWPPPPLASEEPFLIGVLTDENAYTVIAEALRGRKIGEHLVKVVLLATEDDLSTCRVVFIPHTVALTPAEFRARQPKAPVLLVGEKEGFAAAGGEIGFVPRGDNLRYQVNLTAAQRVGLKLSARLANLAEIVRTPSP